MEQTQGVEAVGGARAAREGALQAIHVFFTLLIVLVMVRGLVSFYHTLQLGPMHVPQKAAPAAAKAVPAAAKPAPAAAKAAPAAPAAPAAAKTAAEAPAKTARACPVLKYMDSHPLAAYRLPIIILITLMAVRLLLALRSFDRLYAEGAAWPERSFTGLLIHMGFLLGQVGLLAFMAIALESEETADPTMMFFVGILLLSGLWYLWTRLTAGAEDRQALRYALPAGVSDLVFAALIFGGLFLYAVLVPKHVDAGQNSPSVLGAFLGVVSIYLNYLIAVQAPDDTALAENHVLRSWLAIGIGAIAAAAIVACVILTQKLGLHLPL